MKTVSTFVRTANATATLALLLLGLFTTGCLELAPVTRTVTLDANGGTAGTTTTITIAHGETVPTSTTGLPTRTGYALASWNTKTDGTGTPFVFGTTHVIANITIYAQWSQINPPAIPTGLTATPKSSTQIDLAWTATATATTYNLFDGTVQIGGDITNTKYSHTGLMRVSTHSYTLKACNSAGCSAASVAVNAKTLDVVVSTLAITRMEGDTAASFNGFNGPNGVAVDASGNVYVADANNNKIRKIDKDGVVNTLAGRETYGSADGQGTAASFNSPTGVAVDASGNVYVADRANNKIRKIVQ